MNKKTKDDRTQMISACVSREFSNMSPDEIDEQSAQYEMSTMQMFEVESVKEKSVVLKHLFNDEIYEPVFFPNDLKALIKKKDVFMMTIGFKNDCWKTIWVSPLYS